MSANFGWCDVTLAAGTGTGTWKKWNQVEGGNAAAEAVELDNVPEFLVMTETANAGGATGIKKITATAIGCTITSTHAGDTSTVRVMGWVHAMPQWWQS